MMMLFMNTLTECYRPEFLSLCAFLGKTEQKRYPEIERDIFRPFAEASVRVLYKESEDACEETLRRLFDHFKSKSHCEPWVD